MIVQSSSVGINMHTAPGLHSQSGLHTSLALISALATLLQSPSLNNQTWGATLLIISHFFIFLFLCFIEGGTNQSSSCLYGLHFFGCRVGHGSLLSPSRIRIRPLSFVYHLLSCSWRQMEESEDSRIQLNHEL